jgi:hypothetical protein
MTSCARAAELISRSLDVPLRWRERLALRFHLLVCAMCRRFRRQSLLLQEAGRIAGSGAAPVGEPPTLSEPARDRIKQALRGHPSNGAD